MKIVREYSQDQTVDHSLLQKCRKGHWYNWERTYALAINKKIVFVSLNLFERIIWSLFGSKFECVFKTKKVKILSPDCLKQTEKKVHDQVNKQRQVKNQEPKAHSTRKQRDQPHRHQSAPVATPPLQEAPENPQLSVKQEEAIEPSQEKDKLISELTAKSKKGPSTSDSKKENEPSHPISEEEPASSPAETIKKMIQEGRLEEALEANRKNDTSWKETKSNCIEIAEAYFKKGAVKTAVDVLEKGWIDQKIINQICEKWATSLCQDSKYEESKKLIRKISIGNELIGKIFLKVGEEYYENEDLDGALKIVRQLIHIPNVSGGDDLCIKIAEKNIEQGQLDDAAYALTKIIYPNDKNNQPYVTLAETYYQRGDLKNAFNYNHHDSDYPSCKQRYLNIAKDYKDSGDEEKAIEVLRTIVMHGYLVDIADRPLFLGYLAKNQYDLALKAIVDSPVGKLLW